MKNIHELETQANQDLIWESLFRNSRKPGPPAPPQDIQRMRDHAKRVHAAPSSLNNQMMNNAEAAAFREYYRIQDPELSKAWDRVLSEG